MAENAVARIRAFNNDRIPPLRALKYSKMRADQFTFFRGSNHLFYADWPAGCQFDSSPLAWVCGDLHLENFGTYKGDNRLVYFDVNDFDEAVLAPCIWDVARLATSLILAGEVLRLSDDFTRQLCGLFLETYFSTLTSGSIQSVERENASGLIKKLMRSLKSRQRSTFLDEQSHKQKATRKFKIKETRYLPVSDQERKQVAEIVSIIAGRENRTDFYHIHDIAFRVAGTASLGLSRYAVLVEGRGFPDGNFILDIKEEHPSTLEPFLTAPQPKWASQAERVVSIQKHFQAIQPDLLTNVHIGNQSFLIRELQPSQDRIALADWEGKLSSVENLTTKLAEILAWGQLRCADWEGSSAVVRMMTFGHQSAMRADLSLYAQEYAQKVRQDYKLFSRAYDSGELG